MNPVAAIAHVVAIVLGVWGGFAAIDAVTPELPGDGVEPGVEVPVDLDGGEEESLFNPGPLSTALTQLSEQESEGTEYVLLTLTPSSITTKELSGAEGGFELTFLSTGEPARVIKLLGEERPPVTPERVRQLELVATGGGPVWYVTTDEGAYLVPYGSDEIEADPPLPTPLPG